METDTIHFVLEDQSLRNSLDDFHASPVEVEFMAKKAKEEIWKIAREQIAILLVTGNLDQAIKLQQSTQFFLQALKNVISTHAVNADRHRQKQEGPKARSESPEQKKARQQEKQREYQRRYREKRKAASATPKRRKPPSKETIAKRAATRKRNLLLQKKSEK